METSLNTQQTKCIDSSIVGSCIMAYALVVAISVGISPASAQLPPDYYRCANVEANASVAIVACTSVIQSGHDSGQTLARSYVNRGAAWAKENQLDRAFSDLNQAIRLDTKNARAYSVRGLIQAKKGHLDRAIEDLNQAIGINPRFVQAYNNRGFVYKNKREYDRALADLNSAISIDPSYPLAYFNRAQVWRDKGELDRAIVDLSQGIRFDPLNATAYANRGLLNERNGNQSLALADFNAAIVIDPNQSVALAGRARLTTSSVETQTRLATDGRRTTPDTLTAAPVSPTKAPSAPQPTLNRSTTVPAAAAFVPPISATPPSTNVIVPARPLAEALAACTKSLDGRPETPIEITTGKGKLEFPACYRGRRYLDCVVSALVEEAKAIDRDYSGIVRSNYPDVRDADATCRIDPAQLDTHIGQSKTFDARAAILQKTFVKNAACVEEVRQSLGEVDLRSITDSAALMKSIQEHVSAPIEQASARQRDVVRLMQGIDASQNAMMAVKNVRKLICP
jgi:tetratricopeptide (TPR) repeat protein